MDLQNTETFCRNDHFVCFPASSAPVPRFYLNLQFWIAKLAWLLQTLIKDKRQFLEVPQLSVDDVEGIVTTWLQVAGRNLQLDQFKRVISAFSHSPLPLYLKLCFDEACRFVKGLPSWPTCPQHFVLSAVTESRIVSQNRASGPLGQNRTNLCLKQANPPIFERN